MSVQHPTIVELNNNFNCLTGESFSIDLELFFVVWCQQSMGEESVGGNDAYFMYRVLM